MAIIDTTHTAYSPADPRVKEIQEFAAAEGICLPLPVVLILWFEDRGYVVDFKTGKAMRVSVERVTASGKAVAHLLSNQSGGVQ